MNELVTMTSKEITVCANRVRRTTEKIEKGYISIINDVAALRLSDAHKDEQFADSHYKNFAEFCKGEFGMSKSTMYNLLNIFDRFAVDGKVPQEILDKGLVPLLKEIEEEKNVTAESETEETAVESETEESPDNRKIHFVRVSDAIDYLTAMIDSDVELDIKFCE